LGIIRVFSQLYFERGFAYSLCASFVTCICLFIERDVPYVRLAGAQDFTCDTLAAQARRRLCGASHPRPKYDLLPIGKFGSASCSAFSPDGAKQELIEGDRT
jgi:hypothetical protein